MNVAIATLPTDIALPNWLEDCLTEHQSPLACAEPTPTPNDISLVCQAFEFAYCLHQGQKRASGEPYIAHPVAVAGLLRDLGGSAPMIAAGFLHDIIEDTDVTGEELERRFGAEVCGSWKASPSFLSLISPVRRSGRQKTSGGCSWRWRRIFA